MSWPVHIIAVGALVFNKEGKVLIAKSIRKNTWGFLGGQVEVGESLDEALKREIFEESGIYVTIRKMVGMYSNIQKTTWHDGKTIVPTKLTIDYICDYTGGTVRTSDETSDVRWVTIDEAQKLIDYPIFALRLKNMINFDGNIVYEVFQSQPYIHKKKYIY